MGQTDGQTDRHTGVVNDRKTQTTGANPIKTFYSF